MECRQCVIVGKSEKSYIGSYNNVIDFSNDKVVFLVSGN